jgi:hypothetical protein
MTQQKKLKKVIRARSEKTGESYTAARRQVLLASLPADVGAGLAPAREGVNPAPTSRTEPAKRGISEESVLKKTGHGLDHWFGVLDAFGGMTQGHTAMAAHLYNEHGIPGWHSQGITVAYERARGLREANQACTGKFQVTVSKTVRATVAEVVEALRFVTAWGSDPGLVQALDAAFTGDKPREVKTKGSDYAWLRFPWDGRTVEIRITGKPTGASVVADNKDLPEPALVEQRRAQWRTALEELQRYLKPVKPV